MSAKKKSVSETFFDLIDPAPSFHDPEDIDQPESAAKVVENEDSVSEEENFPSALRKRKFEFLEDGDERYDGTKVSRRALKIDEDSDKEENDENLSSDESEEEDIEDLNDSQVPSHDEEEESEDDSLSEEGEVEDEQSSVGSQNEYDNYSLSDHGDESNNFQHISTRDSEQAAEKSVAVTHQLKLWDNLLECRISFQKVLAAANKLPTYETFPQFCSEGGTKFKASLKHTRKSLKTLLEKSINFQSVMLKSYPETKNLAKNSNNKTSEEVDEEIKSDTEEEEEDESLSDEDDSKAQKQGTKQRSLKEYAELIDEQHRKYKEYWNATIQKWNDKTRVSVGKLNSRNFSGFEQSTVKQIEQVLSNRERLIQRTQLKRTPYDILGEELLSRKNDEETVNEVLPSEDPKDLKNDIVQTKEYNTEIFDDSDFYHQLLRELIERKASNVTDPIQLSRQWLQLQKLRSKMKRKVDTRATKGRKIRYDVHPKLVSYMAPVNQSSWSEEAKTELYNSLFGNCKR